MSTIGHSNVLVPPLARGAGLAIAVLCCAANCASVEGGTKLSTAQYAAIADDVCTGMPAKEREAGLLAYREDVARVGPLFDNGPFGKVEWSSGAVIRLRATPGMSVPWLERVNRCHIALAASGRLVGRESAEDPFLVGGAAVWAAEAYGGYYDVSVRSGDDAQATEILRRSKALLSSPTRQPSSPYGS